MTKAPIGLQELRRRIYRKAKSDCNTTESLLIGPHVHEIPLNKAVKVRTL